MSMLKMFGGMIIGSTMTIVLLGGAPVANQIILNAQSTFHDQYARPDSSLMIYVVLGLTLFLTNLYFSGSKTNKQHALAIRKLGRHHQ